MSDEDITNNNGFTAPYVSWGSFKNLLERMSEQGLPMRIDRSYLSNMAGSTQSHLLKALRELDLIDKNAHPTAALKALVAEPDQRPALIGDLLRGHYAEAISLGATATQSMLEELFSDKYNVTGSTRRKSIAFFLAAAKYAEIPVSTHFKTPKRVSTNGAPKRKAKKKAGDAPAPPADTVTASGDPKMAYVNLLLKKAEAEDKMDPDILDRIERAIGLQASQTSSPNSPGGDGDS